MKAKGVDPVQKELIERIKLAVANSGSEVIDSESIPFVTDANIATHLGEEKSMQQVLELMIEKLRSRGKTVDTMQKPQIIMLT